MTPPVLPPCPTFPSAGGWHYHLALVVVVLYTMSLFALIVWSSWHGRWLSVILGAWLASVVPLVVVATLWEDRSVLPLLHSRAFVFADFLAIPALLGLCASAIPQLAGTRWYHQRWWRLGGSVVLGVIASYAFHLGEIVAHSIGASTASPRCCTTGKPTPS